MAPFLINYTQPITTEQNSKKNKELDTKRVKVGLMSPI